MSQDAGFSEAQKQYLEGFVAALAQRHNGAAPANPAVNDCSAQNGATTASLPPGSDPAAIHIEAQDRVLRAGGTLVPEELAKREKHPFDIWDDMAANAAAGRFPKGLDVFRHKFHGLFYVAPTQDAFMLRLRLPGGIVTTAKARAIADIAETYGAGAIDITTRANLQIRGIGAAHPVAVLSALQEAGLTSRGSGADNIRNLTGSPLAGIDPEELYDTRPLAQALYHYILNHRELYGLPRKFNVAFDGGGCVSVLEDTNDIGFAAVRVGPGKTVPEGVYFRMLLGGLTGHGSFAADAGVLLEPGEVVAAAAAILRVFIEHGDRTDRKKARLKYLIERWGLAETVAEAARHLPFPWRYAPADIAEPRAPIDRLAHIGSRSQAQAGRSYIGLVAPASRMSGAQLRGLADIAERYGSGTLRLTVWQNLIVSDIPDAEVAAVETAIRGLGLDPAPSLLRAGLVACTGNVGCKFALADTKRHALAIADRLEPHIALDRPLNIHLTGCPNSCAQHYVGDIGLLATKVDAGGDDEVEGYHILVGGGAGAQMGFARDMYPSVPADEVPQRIETILRGYLAARRDGESFHDFASRHSTEQLAILFAAPPAEAA